MISEAMMGRNARPRIMQASAKGGKDCEIAAQAYGTHKRSMGGLPEVWDSPETPSPFS